MERLLRRPAAPARRGGAPFRWMFLGVLVSALAAGGAYAQQRPTARSFDLVGTVTDPDGRPLVGAFVALEGSEWGSLTGTDGRFVISRVSRGEVSLTAELIGYAKLEWTGAAAQGSEVRLVLEPEPILLEGLTIVADRFESRRRAVAMSVRWFDRTALAMSPQDNALDFLSARGGLHYVSCRGVWSSECFVVRGRVTEPSVWVDEAPLIGGLDFLRTMPPHELYMVEVYGNGRHIRAYTNRYMERAAGRPVFPLPFVF